MTSSSHQCFDYCIHDPYDVREYVKIRESENNETFTFKKPRTLFIALYRVHMLATVDFNYQSEFEAHKIGDVLANRELPPELRSLDLPRS